MHAFNELAYLVGVAAAYGAVGLLMLVVGGVVIDLLIPGQLRTQIWKDGNVNAAVVVGSGLVGIGIIVIVAIRSSANDLVWGLIDTVAYSILGMVLFAFTFLVIDILTPGKLGETLSENKFHAAVVVTAVANVMISLIIAAAIY